MDLKQRIGTLITQKVVGEPYQTYLPSKLPPNPPIDMEALYFYIDKAMKVISELNRSAKQIPNPSLFI